ncbi:unnamed protein product, partial [Symbiodinium microadriaticum]
DWAALQRRILIREALQTSESPSAFQVALNSVPQAKPRIESCYLHMGYSNLRTWDFGFLQLEVESGPDVQGQLCMVVPADNKPMRALEAFAHLNLQLPVLVSWYRLSDADEPLGVLDMLPRRVEIIPLQLPSLRVWKGASQEATDRQERDHRKKQQKPGLRLALLLLLVNGLPELHGMVQMMLVETLMLPPAAGGGERDLVAAWAELQQELSAARNDHAAEAAAADADVRSDHSLRTEDASISSLSEETLAALDAAEGSEGMDAELTLEGRESEESSSDDSDESAGVGAAARRPPVPHTKTFSGVPELVLDVSPHGQIRRGDVRGSGLQSLSPVPTSFSLWKGTEEMTQTRYYFALLRADVFEEMDAAFMLKCVQAICRRQMEHGPREIADIIFD